MAADLAGTLADVRPAALLEFLAGTAKTGRLDVAGRDHEVSVWLVDGLAVAARPAAGVLDGLVDILRTPVGTFRFSEGDQATTQAATETGTLPGDVPGDLLRQATERLHDWEDLADVVPSLALHVRLHAGGGRDDVTLSGAAWSLSTAVAGGHTSVADAAAHLGWSLYEVCRAVRELVEAGRATLAPPPKRERTTRTRAGSALWPGAGDGDRGRFAHWGADE